MLNDMVTHIRTEGGNMKNILEDKNKSESCSIYHDVTSNFMDTAKYIENIKDTLVQELYDNVPEFNKMIDHENDELTYVVFGELSLRLFEDITTHNQTTDFSKKCFKFFNLIGDREDDEIDNLLIVGIYEGLYANKKCNEIARQLLTGKNKELYEYWMIHGNIRADY